MKAIRTGACAVVFAVALNGCQSHVTLSAPPPTAPQSVRLAAFEKLRSLSYHTTEMTVYESGVVPIANVRKTDYMQLVNGTRVYFPEDVLPLVAADSPTAVAAQASVSKRNTAVYLGLAAAASLVAGLAMVVSSMGPTNELGETNRTPLFLGLGICLGGGLGFGFASQAVSGSAADEAATAFETYNGNLAQHLRLQRQPEVERPAPQPEANAR
jgi:hypothetical protein